MTQPCTNWLRPPKGKEESQHPQMKKRMSAPNEIETRNIRSACSLPEEERLSREIDDLMKGVA